MIQKLSQTEISLSSTTSANPIVLCAADENYVRPLAVTLYSAASSLKRGCQLHVIVMDGGISESSWNGLKETLVDLPISIQVIRPDRGELGDLSISHHISHTAYFRLLAARLLPESIDKVIYLDSDCLVRHDLTELWNLDVGSNYCLAAIDIACPHVDARLADRQFRNSFPYLAAITPIPNWRDLGLDGAQPYFNSGVMVINLQRWREEQIEIELLDCLRKNQKHVWCWDQYALNVVFAKQWKPLPAKWNQGMHLFHYPDPSCSPIAEKEFLQMRDDPAIIHFTTEFKPWDFQSTHPLTNKFFEQLDQTAWNGWRPARPRFSFLDWWNGLVVCWIRHFTVNYRKLALMFD